MTAILLRLLCSHGCSPAVEARLARCAPLIERAAFWAGVTAPLFTSLVARESACRWRVSRKGAVGPAQVVPGTAALLCQRLRWRTRDNLLCGARVLRFYIDDCGDVVKGVGAYNSGKCVRSRWAIAVTKGAE